MIRSVGVGISVAGPLKSPARNVYLRFVKLPLLEADHSGFNEAVSGQGGVSDRHRPCRRINSAPCQRLGVLDAEQCTCQARGRHGATLLAIRPAAAPEKHQMKKPIAKTTEQKCPACNGTGLTPMVQPVQPTRRVYPPPCKPCGGKGQMKEAAN
jgi:hypothetical protein